MINIQQDLNDISGIDMLLSKCGETDVALNTVLIDEDIKLMQGELKKSRNKNDKKNIILIIDYLKSLGSKLDEGGRVRYSWVYNDWQIKSFPLSLRSFQGYPIQATDYVELEDLNLVKIDYREVFEVIAFDMMYRDLDETMETMEKKLEHIGVVTISDASELLSLTDESPLNLSKSLLVEKCPYASVDGKFAWDYFGTAAMFAKQAFTSRKYSDCVGRSVNVAIDLIAKKALTKCLESKVEFQLCAVGESGFYILVQDCDIDTIKDAFENVVVRAFGRKFEVVPKIKVF